VLLVAVSNTFPQLAGKRNDPDRLRAARCINDDVFVPAVRVAERPVQFTGYARAAAVGRSNSASLSGSRHVKFFWFDQDHPSNYCEVGPLDGRDGLGAAPLLDRVGTVPSAAGSIEALKFSIYFSRSAAKPARTYAPKYPRPKKIKEMLVLPPPIQFSRCEDGDDECKRQRFAPFESASRARIQGAFGLDR
jgi:hypothetical protein